MRGAAEMSIGASEDGAYETRGPTRLPAAGSPCGSRGRSTNWSRAWGLLVR